MGSYYYVRDKKSEFGFTPVPEDEYLQAIFRIAKKNGIEITDAEILKEIENTSTNSKRTQINLTRVKKNDSIEILKSPALVR